MRPDEHRAGQPQQRVGVGEDADRYLATGTPDLARDLVGYRQAGIYASDQELVDLIAAIRAAVQPGRRRPRPDRIRRLLTTVLLPTASFAL